MAIIDRIKFDGSSNGSQWLVYKCPSEQFVIGSQLIVNEGQEALFFKGGKALDLFGPNTHTLSTGICHSEAKHHFLLKCISLTRRPTLK